MQIEFIASVAIVTRDPAASRKLFVETLGLPLEAAAGDEYLHGEQIGGSKHFGVWPLHQAAAACLGTAEWPADRPIPQASIEFEVATEAADALAAGARSARLPAAPRRAHRAVGATVARLLSQEGAILGISYAPSLHDPT
jgi:catechol 2,3-dioxygenase-like lactoylglutathione lyase family enzyme